MKNKTNKLIPKLRFKEYSNSVWIEKKLGKIAELIFEKAGDRKYILMSVTSGVGLVSQVEKFGREIAGNSSRNYIVIKNGDFAYNKSSTKKYPEGYIAMLKNYEEAAIPNSIFICFRITDKNISTAFLNYLFHDNFHGKWIKKFLEIGARAHGSLSIDENIFFKMPIVFPIFNEQQKIADCLTSLDEVITLESRKLDALKEHKKGLMQNLFPTAGEKIPKLRFPEFRKNGEWESVRMIDIVQSFKTGKLDANAMVDNGKYRFYTCAKNHYMIDEYAFDTEALLIAGNGAHLGYIHHYKGKFNAYQRTYILSDFVANVIYLKYYLERFLPVRIVLEKKDGNTPYIVLSTITEMPVIIPKDNKQKKIANCLTSIDNIIESQSKKIEALKLHKKGLMQQLFPKFDGNN